jgi:hypothetical protein
LLLPVEGESIDVKQQQDKFQNVFGTVLANPPKIIEKGKEKGQLHDAVKLAAMLFMETGKT